MKPLFSVGEVAILVSKKRPDLNGDVTISGIIEAGQEGKCPHCGQRYKNEYEVHCYFLWEINTCKTIACSFTTEESLRKKHKGSDFSFDEIMNELKSKNPIKA